MKIRLATNTDRAKVLKLLDELRNFTEGRKIVVSKEHRKRSEQVFEKAIQRKDIQIFVADDSHQLLGLATLYLFPSIKHGSLRGHVEDVVVTKKARGKGIGTKLFTKIKQYCKQNNIKVFKLNSGYQLPKAHEFYKKLGGKQTELMFRFDIN